MSSIRMNLLFTFGRQTAVGDESAGGGKKLNELSMQQRAKSMQKEAVAEQPMFTTELAAHAFSG